jgi:hypothetical protein
MVVVGLHLAGAWMLFGATSRVPPREEDSALQLVAVLPPSPRSAAPIASAKYSPALALLSPAHLALELRPWVSDSRPPAQFSDAPAVNVGQVVRICGAALARRRRVPDDSPDVTLLIRVEADGHVSDSKFEAGASAQLIDEATQHCLLSHTVLTPIRIDGEPVASWQRIRWLAGAARRPP